MPSHPPETLQLVANDLEASLKANLGPHTFYVLVVANKLNRSSPCNCISNIPVQHSDQLRSIFGELSNRHVLLHN